METRASKEPLFREDVYSRLKVIHVQTLPVRAIAEDIPVIGKHFLVKHCRMMNTPLKKFTTGALDCLSSCSWPGNTRQLENEIKPLIATVRPKVITEEQLNLQTESTRKESQEEEQV